MSALTTGFGIPITDPHHAVSDGPGGPILLPMSPRARGRLRLAARGLGLAIQLGGLAILAARGWSVV